jgi:hypothetical protein
MRYGIPAPGVGAKDARFESDIRAGELASQGPAREIGGGAGTVGIGAAKGAGHIGEGVAKGAGDVVTLHPVKGATNVVKGTAEGGKDVTVGAAKGTGKIVKGIGKAFKKIF